MQHTQRAKSIKMNLNSWKRIAKNKLIGIRNLTEFNINYNVTCIKTRKRSKHHLLVINTPAEYHDPVKYFVNRCRLDYSRATANLRTDAVSSYNQIPL